MYVNRAATGIALLTLSGTLPVHRLAEIILLCFGKLIRGTERVVPTTLELNLLCAGNGAASDYRRQDEKPVPSIRFHDFPPVVEWDK